MAKHCTVCRSEHRAGVELGLVHGLSAAVLADRYGLSKQAIGRHARVHLSPATAAALLMAAKPTEIDLDALTEREGSALLVNLVHQRSRLAAYAEKALADGETTVAVQCERVIASNLEICGKLLSKFVLRHEHHHAHLLIHPDYLRLRQALLAALRPYPDACAAAAAALHALETDGAKDITQAERPLLEHQSTAP
jgi:hypothetical protein